MAEAEPAAKGQAPARKAARDRTPRPEHPGAESKEQPPEKKPASEGAAPAGGAAAGETGDGQARGRAQKSTLVSVVSKGSNFAVTALFIYFAFVANSFRGILWPKFPDVDPKTHGFIPKYWNVYKPGDQLRVQIWVDKKAWPVKKSPLIEFEFPYEWDSFKPVSRKINATLTEAALRKGDNLLLSVQVTHAESGRPVLAKGGLVKSLKTPEVRPKYHLPSRTLCPEPQEPAFGSKRDHIARGIPMMQVRLVFDTTAYPYPWQREPYLPSLYVDEFWMTNDQLVKLNATGTNTWESEVHFSLMGVARWRFQRHMEYSLEQNAKLFGEESEEMLQMRDLFANTNPYLLTATMVVSILHLIFEVLAFKNDVEFFQGCDPETLNKYVSVQSILVGIFMQVLLVMYLWDESANFLVLITSLAGIVIDMWKVQRAMKFQWGRLFGVVPVPMMVSKVTKEKTDDFDTIAMKWLSAILTPPIIGYAIYTLAYECHRGWYSYFLFVSSSCVYSLGFILMTPQVFINYKHKSVAYLPWKKFIYRACNTFIDDLFAFIVRMPTMHRMSCFRDDIVFLIYLYQRQLYPVDKSRTFDEDGYEISAPATDAIGAPSGPRIPGAPPPSSSAAVPPLEVKKLR